MIKNAIRPLLFLGLILLLSGSCRQKETLVVQDAIFGLASPIVLQPGETPVWWDDYFGESFIPDSILAPEGLSLRTDSIGRVFYLTDQGSLAPVSLLFVSGNGLNASIPVYKSKRKEIRFRFDPAETPYQSVRLAGDMNAWNPANTPLENKNGIWEATLYLIPGVYGYQLELDGQRMPDPSNPDQMSNGMGGFNSKLEVESVPEEQLPRIQLASFGMDDVSVTSQRTDGLIVLWNNREIPALSHGDHYDIRVPEAAKSLRRSYLRIWGYNASASTNYLKVPLEFGQVVTDPGSLNRNDPEQNIMYFVMVDRFFNGDTTNDFTVIDPAIHPRANYHGGDLAGITKKIRDGYFDSLGVNNIWLSPIVRNPDEAYGYYNKGGVVSKFSAYHGYWPVSFTRINTHFGTEEDLHSLISSGHEKNFNLTLDFVANHVHEKHPVYQANKDNGWATNLYLPDGSLNTEKWDEHRLTTWFDVFLPTLNLEKQEITEMLSDSAVFWLEEYAFDGFRHDATKHIPENFWRTLTKKVKAYQKSSGNPVLQLGETYGTPELINSYIGSGMLDGQFDFNVYDALTQSICLDSTGFEKSVERILQSQDYYGTNHVMGNISGNQDRARFMALATGDVRFDEDSKLAGWTRSIQKKTPEGYRKLSMLHAINMTIPGIPVIYYGDEIGLTGGNDPDNRRMMYFEKWNEEENRLYTEVAAYARLRKNHMALLFGDLEFLKVETGKMAFRRKYFDRECILLVNNGANPWSANLEIPGLVNTDEWSSLSGHTFTLDAAGQIQMELPPYSVEIIYN